MTSVVTCGRYQRGQAILDASRAPDGYNVGFNAGRAAGQNTSTIFTSMSSPGMTVMFLTRGGVRHVIDGAGNYLAASQPNVPAGVELFDGIDDRFLKLELIRSLINESFNRIDLLVSFIMRSGVSIIEERLADSLDRGTRGACLDDRLPAGHRTCRARSPPRP